MTAHEYPQIATQENSLGLHYSPLPNPDPAKSNICAEKIVKPKPQSAKIG
jgi:hypothetical protein